MKEGESAVTAEDSVSSVGISGEATATALLEEEVA